LFIEDLKYLSGIAETVFSAFFSDCAENAYVKTAQDIE
jgi:hypothetical protein